MNLYRRALLQLGGLALAARAYPGSASAAPAQPDPLAHVAEELRPTARRMLAEPQLVFSEATLPQIKAIAASQRAMPVPAAVQRCLAPVRPGWRDVPVYVVNASPGAGRPALLHMHGGGFVGGTAPGYLRRIQPFAAAAGCTVVSVDYSLAPEARYGISVEENYAALRWLYREAGALGVDRERIGVMGESAGGCHAALLALAARDRGEVPLRFQLLLYPALDDRTASTRLLPPLLGSVGWSPPEHRFAWRAFLGMEPGRPTTPAAAAPARRTDLEGLPPTFIGVGGIDLLVSENIDYARRLLEAGVPTELIVVPGAFHGFDNLAPETRLVADFNAAKLRAVLRAFGLAAA